MDPPAVHTTHTRLPFTPGQHGLVKRVHHDWLYVETDSVEKVAPLKTVKMVIFMERPGLHRSPPGSKSCRRCGRQGR